jgi:hypothetical protein
MARELPSSDLKQSISSAITLQNLEVDHTVVSAPAVEPFERVRLQPVASFRKQLDNTSLC